MAGVETHSQELRKEIASLVVEAENRQEARFKEAMITQESKLMGIMDELRMLITGMGKSSGESSSLKTLGEPSSKEGDLIKNLLWNSSAKLEFPRFSGEGIGG